MTRSNSMDLGHPRLLVDQRSTPTAARTSWVREMAPHDWVVLTFLAVMTLVSASVSAGDAQRQALARFGTNLVLLIVVLGLVRGGFLRDGLFAPLLYRFALYGSVQLSYFFLGGLLPLVNTSTLDHELHRFDLAAFGVEPAIWMDRWIHPVTTEWFAFFYFGYFFLLAIHVVPILLFARHRRVLGEFALGMILLFCVGHVTYMIVPGFGPYRAVPEAFERSFPPGLWHDLVMEAVRSGGSMMDIFPSLHTAAPTFLLLFSFRHRDKLPFRWSWPVAAFCTVNIILATMFLRWHWVIDVVAGLLLAFGALVASVRLTHADLSKRLREGLSPSWPEWSVARAPVAPPPTRS